jgi:hypothetical protein
VGIGQRADIVDEPRGILDFVEDDGRMQALDEGARVAADAVLNVGVFEDDLLGLRESAAQEGSLARSRRTCNDYHGGAGQCGMEQGNDLAVNCGYMRDLK